MNIIDPSGTQTPGSAEKSAIKCITNASAVAQIGYKEVTRVPTYDTMATLFYLMALSAHFIATSGDEWPASYRNITPEIAEADVLQWMYRGEIELQANRYKKRPAKKVSMRKSSRLTVDLRGVDKHDWIAVWENALSNASNPEDEPMPGQASSQHVMSDEAEILPDAELPAPSDVEYESTRTDNQSPRGTEDDIFDVAECEPDFDLFNGDVTSPDGEVTLSRVNIAHELFMADGEVLDSSDEEV